MNTILILILCIIILLCINFDKNNNIEHFTTENTQNEYEEVPSKNLDDTCSSVFTDFENYLTLAISQNERIISPKIEELESEFTQLNKNYSDEYSIDDDGLCLAEIQKKEFYEKNTTELNKLKIRIQRVIAEIDDYKTTASSNLDTYNSTKDTYLNRIRSVLPEPGNELSNTSHNSVKNKFTSINDKLTNINNTIINNNKLKTAINSIINENQELNNLGSIRTDIEGERIRSNEFLYSFDRTSSQNIINNIEKDDLMYERVNNLCLGSGVVSYADGGGSGGYCNKSDYGCTYTCSSYNTEGECISDFNSVSYNSFQNILGDSVKIHSHIHTHDNMNEEALGSAHPH
tara:strand:+ start:371 stop:1408 length:1038 start_codon:yes stop_codon:yes gene_type:complete